MWPLADGAASGPCLADAATSGLVAWRRRPKREPTSPQRAHRGPQVALPLTAEASRLAGAH